MCVTQETEPRMILIAFTKKLQPKDIQKPDTTWESVTYIHYLSKYNSLDVMCIGN